MSDRELDVALARLLRTGVLIAAAVTPAGSVLWLRQAGGTVADWRTFRGEPVHWSTSRASSRPRRPAMRGR
jgi:hypothetical protein